MAGLTRKTSIPFGLGGAESNFGQFGSKQAGTPQTTQDPAIIQQLAAWQEGWTAAVVSGDKAAYIEDMNGLCLVNSYQITYHFQMGIPEWDSATLYFTGSVVQGPAGGSSAGQWFVSLQGGTPGSGAGQSGNPPPASASNGFWKWVNPPTTADGGLSVNAIPVASTTGPATLVNSHLTDNGTNIVTSLPIKFPDGSVQSIAAVNNSPSVQRNANPWIATPTTGRTFGQVYQNTSTSKALFVSCWVTGGSSTGASITAYSDSNATSPSTIVAQQQYPGTSNPGDPNVFFIVLPGNYYRVVSNGNGTMNVAEWQ
jgi:hypothetical protein